jgi:hypothetical protein
MLAEHRHDHVHGDIYYDADMYIYVVNGVSVNGGGCGFAAFPGVDRWI